jgi:hypothetical protein
MIQGFNFTIIEDTFSLVHKVSQNNCYLAEVLRYTFFISGIPHNNPVIIPANFGHLSTSNSRK